MTVAAVIFDCDGVLADSEWASAAAWKEALATFGVTLSPEEFAGYIGTTDRELAEAFAPRIGTTPTIVLGAAETALREVLADGLAAFPDAIALLDRLEAVPVAVASNSDRWRLDCVLTAVGLASRFEVSVAGDEVAEPKPAPDVYQEAARRLGVEPSACLVFEDSPTGITAATAAGMEVVAVDRGHFPRVRLEGAGRVLDSLDQF